MTALEGQVAIITGAGSGIGEAICLRLAAMGAVLGLVGRNAANLERVQSAIEGLGGKADIFPCDLQDAASVAKLGETIGERYGRCDILVNNAGVAIAGRPLHELAVEDWETMSATNLRGPYLMIRAFAPMMIAAGRGHIANISSLAGHNPVANAAAYSATKWGLNGLTYSVAEELRPHGIRVSAVAPGSVNTRFGGGASGKNAEKKIQPDDIAHVVAMLVTQAPQSFVSEVLVRPTQKP
ncbi:MAG TPA: SDR family NAD(P)-dependent oxidoreductase [Acidisarcina sp.]